MVENAAECENIKIMLYLPEPNNRCQNFQCPPKIQDNWLKAIKKETKFLIEKYLFRRGEKSQADDKIIPTIFVFKAKETSKGYLDKLKACCVACGNLQEKSNPDDIWAPCVFAHTFKVFVCEAAHHGRIIKQLDFIGTFCQGIMKQRLFLQLPCEYIEDLPEEYKEYFMNPQLMVKSIYSTDFVHKVFTDNLQEWLIMNEEIPFITSKVDPSVYIYR
jgi:hypothetical protein